MAGSSANNGSSELTFGTTAPITTDHEDNATFIVTSNGLVTGTPLEAWKFDSETQTWVLLPSGGIPCPDPMTRLQLIALRNAGSLSKDCHYVITNPNAQGNLTAESIILHAVNGNTLSMQAGILTSHDTLAWQGVYDIDTDDVLEVTDNLENKVISNNSIITFPFGVAVVNGNTVFSRGNLIYTAGNFANNTIGSNANVTITGGNVIDCKFEQSSNYIMSGGVLRRSTVGQDADVTIISQDNYDNVWGTSTVYTQVGTGYIRYSTIEATTSWVNGNTNLSNVNSYTSTVNTTGSSGAISNSTLNRLLATNMQNIPSLTITNCTLSDYAQINATGASRLYVYRSSVSGGGRLILSASRTLNMSYGAIGSYGYIQVLNGTLTVNYTDVSSYGYIQSNTTGTNTVSQSSVGANSNFRFLGTSTNNRIYYSQAVAQGSIYTTGTSSNCSLYFCQSNSGGQVFASNSVGSLIYYCNASASSQVRSEGNTVQTLMYYCSASNNGYIRALNNTALVRMYSINISSQSIAEVRNTAVASNLYYCDFDTYYYAYITFTTTGTRSGFFGKGRRTRTITNPVKVLPTININYFDNL